MSSASKPLLLGFVKVLSPAPEEYRGGYLLTTDFGRPVEFLYTGPFRVRSTDRLLHGREFEEYLFSEVLAKPMTDRQSSAPRVVFAQQPPLLGLRRLIPAPVLLVQRTGVDSAVEARPHPDFEPDRAAFDRVRSLVPPRFDFLEPFERIDAAIAEIAARGPAQAA